VKTARSNPLQEALSADETALLVSLVRADKALAEYCGEVQRFVSGTSLDGGDFVPASDSLIQVSSVETAYLASQLLVDASFVQYCSDVEAILRPRQNIPLI